MRKLLCALASLAALASPPRFYADQTWDGGGADNLWSTAANWGLDTLPGFGSQIIFSGTTRTGTINDLAGDTVIGGIHFANTVNGQGFTLGGNRVILGGNITTATLTGGVASDVIENVITFDMLLNGNRTFTTASSTTHGVHNLTLQGNIGETGGSRGITKNGTTLGVLTLTGMSTFTGAVTLTSGIIAFNSIADAGQPSALGAGGTIITGNSGGSTGTLRYTGTGSSTNRQIQIGLGTATSTAGVALENEGSGALNFTNAAFNAPFATSTVAKTLTLRGGNTDLSTISGVIADNNTAGGGLINVTKTGAGTWRLSGANTYTGTTTISGGTLDVGDMGAGSLGSGGLVLQNGAVLQGSGTFTREFSNAATAGPGLLAGASGGFAARGGTLFLDFGGAGATLLLNTGSSRLGTNFVFGSSSADSPVVVLNPVSTNGTFNRVLTVNPGAGGDYAELRGPVTSTGSITKQGAGLLVLTATNTNNGALIINAGTVQVGHPDTNAGTTGTLSFSSVLNEGSLVFHRSDTLAYGNVISGAGSVTQAGAGTTVLTGASDYTGVTLINAGTLQLGNNGATGTLSATSGVVNHATLAFHRNNAHEFSAPISGTGVVSHTGSGITTLLGVNSHSGGTSVTAGVLVFGNAGAKPLNGAATAAAGATLGLRVGAGLFTASDLDAMFAGTMPNVSLDAGAGAGIDTTAGDFTYTTSIPDVPQGLTKTGPNVLTLTGANLYTGPTRLADGVLDVGDLALGALGGGPLFFTNNAVLQGFGTFTRSFSGSATTAGPGQLTGTNGGFAAKGGPLTVNFGGAGAVVTLNNGAARFGQNFVFGSAGADDVVLVVNPLALGNLARTFTVLSGLGGDYAQIQGAISSSTATDGIIKAGPGRLVLSGNNTYTGPTTIQEGTLQIGAGGTTGSINNTSGVTNNGTLVFTRSSNSSLLVSAPISGAGVVVQDGAGVTSLGGANTHTGGTNVLAGALSFRTTAALPAEGEVTVASGATLALGVGAGPDFFTSAQVDLLFAGAFPGITNDSASRAGLDTSAGDFTYGSDVSGTRGLAKLGNNVLSVTGANTYTGATYATGGVLRLDSTGAIPGGIANTGGASNITFNGGVIGLTAVSGDFTRGTGSGAGQARWISNTPGGFAAFGGDRLVNFGGAGAAVTWSNGGGVFGSGLIFSDAAADSTVTVVNPIALNFVNSPRTITVHDGSAEVDAVMAGALSSLTTEGNGTRLIKNGAGTLALTAANQYVSGSGNPGTTISAGVLQLGNGGATGSLLYIPNTTGISSHVSISSGAVFAFNRSDDGLLVPNTIIGAGQVRQLGAGTTTLSGENTYTGGTLVQAGALLLANTAGSAVGSGAVMVSANAMLGGTGSAALLGSAQVSMAGTLSPGLPDADSGLGALTISTEDGNLTFEGGAALVFQIGAGGVSDRLIFSSSAGGVMDFSALAPGGISVVYAPGYAPVLDDEFDLLDWSAAVGDGAQGLSTDHLSLTTTGFAPGWMWDTSLFTSRGVLRVSLVPEPSRALLLTAGAAGLMLRRRRFGRV